MPSAAIVGARHGNTARPNLCCKSVLDALFSMHALFKHLECVISPGNSLTVYSKLLLLSVNLTPGN